jgi:RimJ/RimL family protein N-acetyltransferase
VQSSVLRTDRLELRRPVEADRSLFVSLFRDDEFMVFADGTLSADTADARFDVMLQNASEIPFAKQPVIRRDSGKLIGYCGVAPFEFEGQRRLEFGWRLIPEARGCGYATEAGAALLELAADSFTGEVLAMIDPTNTPSQRVAAKLGFEFWKMATVGGYLDGIHRVQIAS